MHRLTHQFMRMLTPQARVYATWNPVDKADSVTLTGGNLTGTSVSGGLGGVRATQGKSSGKWYWEVVPNATFIGTCLMGMGKSTANIVNYPGVDADGWGYFGVNGNKHTSDTGAAYGVVYAGSDVIGHVLDMDGGTITWYKNGVSQGIAFSGLTGTIFPMVGNSSSGTGGAGSNWVANFGATAFAQSVPAGVNPGVYI